MLSFYLMEKANSMTLFMESLLHSRKRLGTSNFEKMIRIPENLWGGEMAHRHLCEVRVT